MKNNNIIQHLLVQLLNPGMYNEAMLKASIEEFKKQDINSLMEQRFNFQNLKPAILPIQEEWLDKPFYTFFKDFSKEHNIELSNGSIYQINLYNLCLIVQEFKNKEASLVAKEIVSAIKASPGVDIKKIEMINFSNKNCNFELKINAKQFLTADYSKSHLNSVDEFCIKALTNKGSQETDIYEYLQSAKKQEKLVQLLIDNPNDKWKMLNAFLIGTRANMAVLANYPKILNYIVEDKIFIDYMMGYINQTLSSPLNKTYNAALYTSFLGAAQKKFDDTQTLYVLTSIMGLPENHQYSYTTLMHKKLFTLDIQSATSYIENKMLKNKAFNYKTLNFLTVNLKVDINKKTEPAMLLKYLDVLGQLCQKGFTTNPINLVNLIAPIEKALEKDLIDIDTLKVKSKEIYQILVQHGNNMPFAQTLLDKGWHFTNKVETLNKSYAASALKLTKAQVIMNEKNLISNSIAVTTKTAGIKFKV